MSRLRPDAEVQDGPTADANVPSELEREAAALEVRFYDLIDQYRRTLSAEDVSEEERALWQRRIETEMQAVNEELDRVRRKR